MKFEDLKEPNKAGLIQAGYSFVLRGDFNSDAIADLAFVGKDEEAKKTFFSIVSIKGKVVTRIFFEIFDEDQVIIVQELNFRDGVDAILLTDDFASDYCIFIYWNRKEFAIETMPERFLGLLAW